MNAIQLRNDMAVPVRVRVYKFLSTVAAYDVVSPMHLVQGVLATALGTSCGFFSGDRCLEFTTRAFDPLPHLFIFDSQILSAFRTDDFKHFFAFFVC